ncbi:MAG: plasmid partitioning protein RepB C-terminal domain-containing protein [Gemmataceae bacterium]
MVRSPEGNLRGYHGPQERDPPDAYGTPGPNLSRSRALAQGEAGHGVGVSRDPEGQADPKIEIAELMCAADNFSEGYVKCLVATTTVEQLVDSERGKELKGLTPEDIARMEHEMESQTKEFRLIEEPTEETYW